MDDRIARGDARAFHASSSEDLKTLGQWLASRQPTLCLVSDPRRWEEFARAWPGSFRILATSGPCRLLTNKQAPDHLGSEKP
jgi:hypothetical protein